MTVHLDWGNLGFCYRKTAGHIHYTYRDGHWDGGREVTKDTIEISIAATALHYGQSCFDGGKAFRQADGKIRIFRPYENAKRLNTSINYLLGPEIPVEMYIDAVKRAIKMNIDYVPPYGSRGALYIRPLVFGSTAQIGLDPANQYEFILMVVPVGDYYKDGIHAVDAMIMEDFDRAAPSGTGHVKLAANYAAGLMPAKIAKDRGFSVSLFLDSRTHTTIEEFSTSNFIGISKKGSYVTPDSRSILPGTTNEALRQLAKFDGLAVEQRAIYEDELAEFTEVGACGTAVVITPIRRIVHGHKEFRYYDGCGPVLKKLYDHFTAIQYGEAADEFNWLMNL